MKNLKKAIIYGIVSVIIVVVLNIGVLSLLNFPQMAKEVVKKYIVLVILLIGGFGFQVGLFTYVRYKNAIGCSTTLASGSISSVSMILCCSHYLLNILPFLGAFISISALSFLSRYTLHFLVLGILSNIAGISIMFYKLKEKNG
jgi:hypothetical protein